MNNMKNLFEGASGVRSFIYIFVAVAAGFASWYATKGDATAALKLAEKNEVVLLDVQRKQDLSLYRINQSDALNEKQSSVLQKQTIILDRLAHQLDVDTNL